MLVGVIFVGIVGIASVSEATKELSQAARHVIEFAALNIDYSTLGNKV